MEYNRIDGIDKDISRIVFGTTSLEQYDEATDRFLNEILDLGITCIDTARVYGDGNVEYVLGQWIEKNKNRENVVILTKGAHPDMATWRKRVNRKDIMYDVEVSLSALRTDYIDIYLLHRDDPEVPVGEVLEIMQELKELGKVKVFGGSNWSVERIVEANEYAVSHGLTPFAVSSPHFGLAEQYEDLWRDGVTLTGEANQKYRDWYQNTQMPIFAYSSLGCGILSGKVKSTQASIVGEILDDLYVRAYARGENFNRLARCEELAQQKNASVSQIALAWLLRQPLNTFALASARTINRIKENIGALDVPLSEAECEYLLKGSF